MKRLPKIAVLSLLSIMMVGCNRGGSASEPVVSSNQPEVSESSTSSSTPEASSISSKEAPVSSSHEEGASESTSSSSASQADPYKSGWSTAIVDFMLQHLGNQIVPYVNLGKSVSANWVVSLSSYGYADIESISGWKIDILTEAKTAFEADGWTTNFDRDKFTASKEGTGLSVTISPDTENTYAIMKIDYDEPYDTSAATDYDDDAKLIINSNLGTQSIPYVYLGSKYSYVTTRSGSYTYFYIYGGKWNSQVISDANTTLTGLGWKTTAETDKLVATLITADGWDFTLTISNYSSGKKARMEVEWVEPFDEAEAKGWSDEIKDYFTNDFDGHNVPDVYMGTDNVTSYYSSTSYKLTLTGGLFRSQYLTLAKQKFEADAGEDGKSYWTITDGTDSYGANFTATRAYDDGCQMSVLVNGSSTTASSNKCHMVITYVPAMKYDKTLYNKWSEDVTTLLDKAIGNVGEPITPLDGHDLPYVYLNTNKEVPTWNNDYRRLQIKGGNWNPNVVTEAKATYQAAGWTITPTTNSYGECLLATKTFMHDDGVNGCKLTVKIDAGYSYSSTVYMYVYIEELYNSSLYTAWDSDILGDFTDKLGGIDFPVINMGSKLVFSSFSGNTETLKGGVFNDQMYTDIKNAFLNDTKNTWTITKEFNTTESTPTMTLTTSSDKGNYTVNVKKYGFSSYINAMCQITITYKAPFNVPSDGSYSSDVTTSLTTNYGADVVADIPYVYLGGVAGKETKSYTSSYRATRITGGSWDEHVIDNAKNVLTSAGYVLKDKTVNYAPAIEGVKTRADGSHIRVTVFKSGTSDSASAVMNVIYDLKSTLPDTAGTDWSEDEKTSMKKSLDGNVVPFLYMGGTKTTLTEKKDTNTYYTWKKYASGTDCKPQFLYDYEEKLKADGWSVNFMYFVNSSQHSDLYAEKNITGGTLRIKIQLLSSSVYFTAAYDKDYVADPTYEREEANTTKLKNYYGIDIPSLYLGENTSYTFTDSTKKTVIKGSGKVTAAFRKDIEDAFKNDTKNTWTLTYMAPTTTSMNGKVLVASTINNEGKYVSCQFYEYSAAKSDSSVDITYYYPEMEIHIEA